jgi:hypothetical protein
MLKKVILIAGCIMCCIKVEAQTVTDTTAKLSPEPASPLKTLTYKQYDAYLKGDDLYTMDWPATLNHYPLPDQALKHKHEINLSPIQIGKITVISNNLHRKKLDMGEIIIRNEHMLDSLFKTHNIDDGTIIFYANRSGLYYGEVRNAILQACFATEKLLSNAQIKQLELLEKHNN